MNLQNPSSLYSGGQGIFDSTPYRVAYQRNQQLKAAKDEALDKYYQNLPNTVNSQGVRDQEVPVINDAKDKLQQFWMANRDAIRKGNTPANYNYQKMVREVQGIVQESKNRTANNAKLAPYLLDPKYAYVRKNKNLMDIVAANDLPVGSEGSKSFNFSELLTPPPPFDPAKYINGIKVKPNPQTPTYQPIKGDKFNRLEITEKGFSDDDKIALHLQAQTEMDNNPSFEEEIKGRLKQNPALVADITEKFTKVYGHKIENDGDLATAYTLSLMDLTPIQKTVVNREALNADRQAFSREMAFLQDKLISRRKTSSGDEETVIGFPTVEIGNAYGEPGVKVAGMDEDDVVVYSDKIPVTIKRVINPTDVNKMILPVKEFELKQPDGTYRKAFIYSKKDGSLRGKGNKKIGMDDSRALYIDDLGSTKVKVGLGNKGVINTPKQTVTPAPKSNSFIYPTGKTKF
jgi:hypothetical protein